MIRGDLPRHSVSVAAVVVDDSNRVLVIRRQDNGAWQLPGGVLELDERGVATRYDTLAVRFQAA